MPKLRLHLDADASRKPLYATLKARGYDVTRTPNEWLAEDANDPTQLSFATKQRRCIFSFNHRDFVKLARQDLNHYGIIIAAQNAWTLSALIAALDRVLRELEEDDLIG